MPENEIVPYVEAHTTPPTHLSLCVSKVKARYRDNMRVRNGPGFLKSYYRNGSACKFR